MQLIAFIITILFLFAIGWSWLAWIIIVLAFLGIL
jgi:hypothetical protein